MKKMNRMNKMKMLIAGLAFVVACVCRAASSDGILEGWSGDFIACTNQSIQTHTPLVMIWANKFCSHCETLEADVVGDTFVQWREESGYIFCFVLGSGIKGLDPDDAPGAKTFAGTAGGTMSSTPSSYPFVCLYWPKVDGTISAYRFTTQSADEVMYYAETVFKGYVAKGEPDVFSFAVSDVAFDRLEALSTTTYVDVPVTREIKGGGVVTNAVVSTWPDSLLPVATNLVVWSATETQKLVRVSVSRGGVAFPTGKTMSLALLNAEGEKEDSSGNIHFIEEPGNSVLNPKWVGEDCGYGEWTMDYEAAKEKDGYVLALFSGVLWCPYCYGMETTLLADPAFKAWAVSNKVSLVLFDQSRASTPATAAGSGLARLLAYDAGTTSTREGGIASGAGYLSRKSISSSEAQDVIDQTTKYTAKWLAPGSTAARLGNPTMLLVKDDTVLGRLTSWRDSDKNYDADENIGRLNDLLLLAEGNGEGDNYVQTTTRTLTTESAQSADFQINDRIECFKIDGVEEGTIRLSVTNATKTAGFSITLSSEDETYASANADTLDAKITAAMAAGTLYAKITAFSNATEKICAGGESSVFSATVAVEQLPDSGSVSFATNSLRVAEADGVAEITVVRTGGADGVASVKIAADKSASAYGRYTWADTTLSWADGERGTKTAKMQIAATDDFEGNETVNFSLSAASDNAAEISSETLSLTIYDSELPSFGVSEAEISMWSTLNASSEMQLENTNGNPVKFVIVSGSLPPGVTLECDEETGMAYFTGVPTQAGTYTATIGVKAKIAGQVVKGEKTAFTFNVTDPSTVNAQLGKARATQTIALVADMPDNYGEVLAGKLLVKLSKTNKIKAKYYGTESKSYYFEGLWDDVDSANGTATTTLENGETTLTLSLDADGEITAEVTAPESSSLFAPAGSSITLNGTIAAAKTGEFDAYAGRYTVQLPVAEPDGSARNSGSASLVLRMTSESAINKGLVSYSGLLPNGKTIAGSAYLEIYTEADEYGFESEYARLPIFVRNSTRTFGAFLRIKPNAAATWESPTDSIALPAVSAFGDSLAYSTSREDAGKETLYHNVYGSYYEGGHTIAEICDHFELDGTIDVNIGIDGFSSARYSSVNAWPSAVLAASGKSFKVIETDMVTGGKYKKASGIVTGKAKVEFESKTISGVFGGVLLPGWVDCHCGEDFTERPFVAGTFYFIDYVKVDGVSKTIKRGVPMTFEIPNAE